MKKVDDFKAFCEISEKSFIIKFKDFRKSCNITQEELAKKTGLTQQQISLIESGKTSPTLSNAIRYLHGVGLDVHEIFPEGKNNRN